MFDFLKKINKKGKVIFLHMPKAGGTTLRQLFYDQYNHLKPGQVYTINRTKETYKFINLSEREKKKIEILIGHMPFGLHEELSSGFKYVTFLRNPLERVLSAYSYNREKHYSDVYDLINDEKLSLKSYLDKNIEPWLNNAMTKHLYGCTQEEFMQECTEEMFQKAIENLNEHFSFVGITEMFDESLVLLKDILAWDTPRYEKLNQTGKKTCLSDLSEETINRINELNKYDIRLYQIALKQFKELWESYDKDSKQLELTRIRE